MKVYALPPQEDWICDRFVREWNDECSEFSTSIPGQSDVIWLVADWCYQRLSEDLLAKKKVIATVHHIVPEKFDKREADQFRHRDQFVDAYHVPCKKTEDQVSRVRSFLGLPEKKIFTFPFWVNQTMWYPSSEEKGRIRKRLGIRDDVFLIGSFQRDTEGKDLVSPKLEKGPDLFCDIVDLMVKKDRNIQR